MLFWNEKYSGGVWKPIDLSGEGCFFYQCADFCLNHIDCNAILVIEVENFNIIQSQCYINKQNFTWESDCSDHNVKTRLGVFSDYYCRNPENLPTDVPNGIVGDDKKNC